ncbi:hypothetical protein MJ585_25180 [Klebsiella pneumoniae]|nr:hypothetical protein MJ585_25180 [Klebsiella pneumoniae]
MVEGAGDSGCEYDGGIVVLGKAGVNFGAGMTGSCYQMKMATSANVNGAGGSAGR